MIRGMTGHKAGNTNRDSCLTATMSSTCKKKNKMTMKCTHSKEEKKAHVVHAVRANERKAKIETATRLW